MTRFYLEKTLAMPGDLIPIHNDCVGGNRVFESDNPNIAITYVDTDWKVNAIGVGTANITETTGFCDVQTPITLVVTDDGLAPLINTQDYFYLIGLEVIVFGIILSIASFRRFNNWI